MLLSKVTLDKMNFYRPYLNQPNLKDHERIETTLRKDLYGFVPGRELGWMTCSRVKGIYFCDQWLRPNNFCFVKNPRKAQNFITCMQFGVVYVAQL